MMVWEDETQMTGEMFKKLIRSGMKSYMCESKARKRLCISIASGFSQYVAGAAGEDAEEELMNCILKHTPILTDGKEVFHNDKMPEWLLIYTSSFLLGKIGKYSKELELSPGEELMVAFSMGSVRKGLDKPGVPEEIFLPTEPSEEANLKIIPLNELVVRENMREKLINYYMNELTVADYQRMEEALNKVDPDRLVRDVRKRMFPILDLNESMIIQYKRGKGRITDILKEYTTGLLKRLELPTDEAFSRRVMGVLIYSAVFSEYEYSLPLMNFVSFSERLKDESEGTYRRYDVEEISLGKLGVDILKELGKGYRDRSIAAETVGNIAHNYFEHGGPNELRYELRKMFYELQDHLEGDSRIITAGVAGVAEELEVDEIVRLVEYSSGGSTSPVRLSWEAVEKIMREVEDNLPVARTALGLCDGVGDLSSILEEYHWLVANYIVERELPVTEDDNPSIWEKVNMLYINRGEYGKVSANFVKKYPQYGWALGKGSDLSAGYPLPHVEYERIPQIHPLASVEGEFWISYVSNFYVVPDIERVDEFVEKEYGIIPDTGFIPLVTVENETNVVKLD